MCLTARRKITIYGWSTGRDEGRDLDGLSDSAVGSGPFLRDAALVRRVLGGPPVVYLWLAVTLAGFVAAVVVGQAVWALAGWAVGGVAAVAVADRAARWVVVRACGWRLLRSEALRVVPALQDWGARLQRPRGEVARLQVVPSADEPHGVAPSEPVESEVGGHLDDQVGADTGVGGPRCAPAVPGQTFGQAWACCSRSAPSRAAVGERSGVVRPTIRSRPVSSGRPRISSRGTFSGPVMPPTTASAVRRVRSFCHPRRPGL